MSNGNGNDGGNGYDGGRGSEHGNGQGRYQGHGEQPHSPYPSEGWGGEYDADATAFVQLPAGGLPESRTGGDPWAGPLAAPGTGQGGYTPPPFDPAEVAGGPSMTSAPGADATFAGHWPVPFDPDAAGPSLASPEYGDQQGGWQQSAYDPAHDPSHFGHAYPQGQAPAPAQHGLQGLHGPQDPYDPQAQQGTPPEGTAPGAGDPGASPMGQGAAAALAGSHEARTQRRPLGSGGGVELTPEELAARGGQAAEGASPGVQASRDLHEQGVSQGPSMDEQFADAHARRQVPFESAGMGGGAGGAAGAGSGVQTQGGHEPVYEPGYETAAGGPHTVGGPVPYEPAQTPQETHPPHAGVHEVHQSPEAHQQTGPQPSPDPVADAPEQDGSASGSASASVSGTGLDSGTGQGSGQGVDEGADSGAEPGSPEASEPAEPKRFPGVPTVRSGLPWTPSTPAAARPAADVSDVDDAEPAAPDPWPADQGAPAQGSGWGGSSAPDSAGTPGSSSSEPRPGPQTGSPAESPDDAPQDRQQAPQAGSERPTEAGLDAGPEPLEIPEPPQSEPQFPPLAVSGESGDDTPAEGITAVPDGFLPQPGEGASEAETPEGHTPGGPQSGSEPAPSGAVPGPEAEPGAEAEPGPVPEGAAIDPELADIPALTPEFGGEHPHVSYVLRVNGVERPVTEAWIGESLLYVLRERLGLAGAKDGCSQGECGACSVQVDGRLVASCLVPAATAAGSEIRTVEGLAADGAPSDVQRALTESGAVQCGFCVPGLAMTVHDLLEGNHSPSELEARQALSGNLCRCSGYRGVLDAVRTVVSERAARDAYDYDTDEEAEHQPPSQERNQNGNQAPLQDQDEFQAQDQHQAPAHVQDHGEGQGFEEAPQPQHYDAQHYDPQHYDAQHYDAQHYDPQHHAPQTEGYDAQGYDPQAQGYEGRLPGYDVQMQGYDPHAYDPSHGYDQGQDPARIPHQAGPGAGGVYQDAYPDAYPDVYGDVYGDGPYPAEGGGA